MRRDFPFLLALLLGLPLSARAQAGSCNLIDSGQVERRTEGGASTVYVTGPLLVTCTGGTELRADNAVIQQATNEVQLSGNVFYRDPTRTLSSQQANYSSATGRLYATGDVIFTDTGRGSTLRGPEVEYFRAMPGRPEVQVLANGRPHLTLVPAAADGEPLEVDADRLDIRGQDQLSAFGNVEIRRTDLQASGAEATFNSSSGDLRIRGGARVVGERFELAGETIDATLREQKLERVFARTGASLTSRDTRLEGETIELTLQDQKLQRIIARNDASLVGEKIRVRGPELKAFFEDELLERLVARGDSTVGGRPVATATGFRMQADSIEAILPRQRLERVVAVGNARGEATDTTESAAAPADSSGALDVSAPLARDRDWITGDTLTGYFAVADSAARPAADSASAQPEIELLRLVAVGSARSLYRVQEENAAPGARPGLNYLAGETITLVMDDGELDVATVLGLRRGVYLDPAAPGSDPAAPAPAEPPASGESR